MLSLKCLLLLCVPGFWTVYAGGCTDRQAEINGRCCDMCPPGQYVKSFCTQHEPTVCSPCEDGSFSDHYTVFGRCEECQSCQQDYEEKCTPTTNSKCLCRLGFLCSDSVCSTCEENECVPGEKLKRTEMIISATFTKYLHQCEPVCPDRDYYYDVKDQKCKPRTQCSALGLPELFSGNKTHNSVCDVQGLISIKNGNLVPVTLGISFAVCSVCFLVPFLLFLAYKRNLRSRKSNKAVLTVCNNSDFHLSKEESGHQLILQDETKDNKNLALLLGIDTRL